MTTYPRVLQEHFPRFISRPVTLLGSIQDVTDRKIRILLDNGDTIYGEYDSSLAQLLSLLKEEQLVEFRGTLRNNNMLEIASANGFPATEGTKEEIIPLYQEMVRLQRRE